MEGEKGGEGEGRGGERMWRGPESGLPRGPCWLSAGLPGGCDVVTGDYQQLADKHEKVPD